MIELIVLIIFILSFGGAVFILVRKIPNLNTLPYNGTVEIKKHHFIQKAENNIKSFFIFFEKQIFLHKLLSWIKVMTLKIETKVDHALHGIRKKAQQVDKNKKKF